MLSKGEETSTRNRKPKKHWPPRSDSPESEASGDYLRLGLRVAPSCLQQKTPEPTQITSNMSSNSRDFYNRAGLEVPEGVKASETHSWDDIEDVIEKFMTRVFELPHELLWPSTIQDLDKALETLGFSEGLRDGFTIAQEVLDERPGFFGMRLYDQGTAPLVSQILEDARYELKHAYEEEESSTGQIVGGELEDAPESDGTAGDSGEKEGSGGFIGVEEDNGQSLPTVRP